MSELLGLKVSELVDGLRERAVRMPFEIGAFIALETTEALLERPSTITPDDVRLEDDGSILIFAPSRTASPDEACQSVVSLLARLLVASGAGVPPMMLRLVERGPSDGSWDLTRLRDELEASLVPLNRGAARRVLARLLREVSRERRAPRTEASVVAMDLDLDLDALLDGRRAPPAIPPQAPTQKWSALDADAAASRLRPATTDEDRELDALLGLDVEPEPVARDNGERVLLRAPSMDGLDERPLRREAKKQRNPVLLYLVVFLTVFALAVVVLRPDLIETARARFAPTAAEPAMTETESSLSEISTVVTPPSRPETPAQTSRGDLLVRVSEPRAQVLLAVGRGPAVVEDLPTGVAYEFVVIPDGGESTRAVVPATVNWQPGGELVFHELRMRAGDAQMEFSDLALGESLLRAETMGAATDRLGRIRVVTEPANAKVYLLVGFSPNVRIRDLPVDREHELLVYHDGHPLRRIVVPTDAWTVSGSRPVAEIAVNLQ